MQRSKTLGSSQVAGYDDDARVAAKASARRCARGVTAGSRPSGGSTISDVCRVRVPCSSQKLL